MRSNTRSTKRSGRTSCSVSSFPVKRPSKIACAFASRGNTSAASIGNASILPWKWKSGAGASVAPRSILSASLAIAFEPSFAMSAPGVVACVGSSWRCPSPRIVHIVGRSTKITPSSAVPVAGSTPVTRNSSGKTPAKFDKDSGSVKSLSPGARPSARAAPAPTTQSEIVAKNAPRSGASPRRSK